ncbi:MAG TPA: hypothetical protein VJB57_20535 [Dehalococcoidia bacterium]|nr:hypothetical protein [Dehalococcoidia bacterium]
MKAASRKQPDIGDKLYEAYGKPLESEHWGEYVAISPRGETVLRATLLEVAEAAAKDLGPGVFVFKVGERAVGKWR